MNTDDELTLKAAEDARLLDAARDMLEALTTVLDAIGALSKPHELLDIGLTETEVAAVYAAIAKAEGKQ